MTVSTVYFHFLCSLRAITCPGPRHDTAGGQHANCSLSPIAEDAGRESNRSPRTSDNATRMSERAGAALEENLIQSWEVAKAFWRTQALSQTLKSTEERASAGGHDKAEKSAGHGVRAPALTP